MTTAGKAVLVTGANRGIGQALVEEALKRGAKRVYAGTRHPFSHLDERVTPLTLDVTNVSQIQRAVDAVGALDVLINNAGVAIYDDLSNLDVIEQHLAVNFLGLLKVTHAFAVHNPLGMRGVQCMRNFCPQLQDFGVLHRRAADPMILDVWSSNRK